MEYCLPQLLSRDEIVRILNERQLQIPNIDILTHQELLTIYTTFAVPLAKRDARVNPATKNNGAMVTTMDVTPQRFAVKRLCTSDVNNVHLESLHINDESGFPKRTKISDTNLTLKKEICIDNTTVYSSIAKKRKVITWP